MMNRRCSWGSSVAIAVLTLTACEVVDSKSTTSKQDTTAAARVGPDSAAGTVVPDSAVTAQPVAGDSAAVTPTPDDTGVVRIYPPEVRRGGVLFALAEGLTNGSPRCTWKSAPIPCYTTGEGTLVTIPLPADDDAGTFTLTFDRPNGKIVRQVTVADREFPRELILLTDSLYKRATSTKEIARDARAVKGIASMESSERRWSGRWREPITGTKSTGYGVERYYYRATDSTRSIQLDAQAKTRATFGGDTSDVAFTGAPSWRHAGIDLPARRGASVTAPASGVVIDVGDYVPSGRTLLIGRPSHRIH